MEGIGNTPLIKLNKLTGPNDAEVYVKYEGANPTGSMKDRMALSMIEGALDSGVLKPGMRVIEYTGGSTGSSLAMVCAKKGIPCYFVSSDAFAAEKIQMMRAFGATVELIPSGDGSVTPILIQKMGERLREIEKEGNCLWVNQFNNPNNKRGYHAMADEIISAMEGEFDEFIGPAGTGGCFSGNSERLKERMANVRCLATEPYYVRVLTEGQRNGKHRLEGMGIGFVTSIFRTDLVDEVVPVKDEDAFEIARRLSREEGLMVGISSGANVWAALQRAKELGPGKRIVTVACDSGLKYLNGDLFEE